MPHYSTAAKYFLFKSHSGQLSVTNATLHCTYASLKCVFSCGVLVIHIDGDMSCMSSKGCKSLSSIGAALISFVVAIDTLSIHLKAADG